MREISSKSIVQLVIIFKQSLLLKGSKFAQQFDSSPASQGFKEFGFRSSLFINSEWENS